MSSLDLNQILSEEERIPCTFTVNALKLGHLDLSAESHDLSETTQVDIPMWLGEQLSSRRVVEINPPKHYGKKMRDEMRAGATSINLRDFSHYFFDTGLHLAHISRDEQLRKVLECRFPFDEITIRIFLTIATNFGDVILYSSVSLLCG